MATTAYPPLDITAHWGRLNDTLIQLLDYVPDEQMGWSPREDLWNFRGILLHTIMTRDGWLGSGVKDGGPTLDAPDAMDSFLRRVQSKKKIKRELRRSWERIRRFLSDAPNLSAEYHPLDLDMVTGHWIAFHLLEHDIHHRADIFHYLALLEIEHPEVGTP